MTDIAHDPTDVESPAIDEPPTADSFYSATKVDPLRQRPKCEAFSESPLYARVLALLGTGALGNRTSEVAALIEALESSELPEHRKANLLNLLRK